MRVKKLSFSFRLANQERYAKKRESEKTQIVTRINLALRFLFIFWRLRLKLVVDKSCAKDHFCVVGLSLVFKYVLHVVWVIALFPLRVDFVFPHYYFWVKNEQSLSLETNNFYIIWPSSLEPAPKFLYTLIR